MTHNSPYVFPMPGKALRTFPFMFSRLHEPSVMIFIPHLAGEKNKAQKLTVTQRDPARTKSIILKSPRYK